MTPAPSLFDRNGPSPLGPVPTHYQVLRKKWWKADSSWPKIDSEEQWPQNQILLHKAFQYRLILDREEQGIYLKALPVARTV
jgi:hypothetical protein